MTDRTPNWVGFGALWLALGPVAALFGALDLTATAELAIATHVALMLSGVAFMAVGLLSPGLELSKPRQDVAFWSLMFGASVVFITGALAALLGVGGDTLSAFGTPTTGSAAAETAVRLGVILGGVSALLGFVIVGQGVVDSHREGTAADPMSARFLQVGLVLLGIGITSGLLGLTAIPALPAATSIGAVISGLMFLAFGLVWPRIAIARELPDEPVEVTTKGDPIEPDGLDESLQRTAFRLLAIGAFGNLITGLLAAALGTGVDTTSLSPAGVLGSQGSLLVVKLTSLLAVLSTVAGVVLVWHGLPKPAPKSEGAMKSRGTDWMTARFIRLGVLVVLLAVISALLTSLTRAPRVAVGTYATALIIGPMLICIGLAWPRFSASKERSRGGLSEARQQTAFNLLAVGALGILASGMLLALFGIGGETLSVSGAPYVGTESQELVARILVDVSALLVAIGLFMVWLGVRQPAGQLSARFVQLAWLVVIALALEGVFYHVYPVRLAPGTYPLQLPSYDYAELDYDEVKVAWLWDDSTQTTAQNWTPDDWQWFYHAPQGGAFELPVPYEWLMNLEQPVVRLWPRLAAGRLMAPDYLARFGFLPNPKTTYDPEGVRIELHPGLERFSRINEYAENNLDLLPVGFVRTPDWVDHETGETIDAMGFTCAACHTGQVDYVAGDTLYRVRIEGGPANVELGKFRSAVGLSLALTKLLPGRLERFAAALGRSAPEEEALLREELDRLLDRGQRIKTVSDSIYPTEEGFARLDAIGRIANYVFGHDLGIEENVQVADAPVNFPHIWDAPWFEWVQYNASFKQPMMRNAGESMGVFASVDMVGSGPEVGSPSEDPLLFSSSVDIMSLHEMETLIAGQEPGAGLESPEWPGFFPRIDSVRVESGKELYRDYCAICHLPGTDSADAFYEDVNWTARDEHGNSYLALEVRNLQGIGTDPRTAINFRKREVELGELGERLGLGRRTTAGEALPFLIRQTKERRYSDYQLSDDLRLEMDGYRPDRIAAPLGYRARPLNGIWATPPFLHNGSVPNLYELLSPQSERSDRFYLGSRLFDPVLVGFDSNEEVGFFELDTTLPGNSNEGHLFEGGESTWSGPAGVIGPTLTHEQRMDLIEYLKSLPPLPLRP